jgi:UDP-N-acetylmuramate: L-alanyl-gamma-D-glutamyl-meso-diaminopimelate ligase
MEGDEYVVSLTDRRSKFELYAPAHALISSLVHDHVNMFPTFEAYAAPFEKLVAAVPDGGLLVCARGHERLAEIVKGRKVVWYGADEGEGYSAQNIVLGEITRFDLVTPAGGRAPIETQLLGRHNIENIVGAAAFVLERGLMSPGLFAEGVAKFRGVSRRLDKKTTVSRIPAYEGFGSSYEKARSAIEAISAHFPTRRQVVVFEPHTFSWRNRDALGWYDTVFRGVDCVFMLPPPMIGADDRQIDQAAIVQRVAMSGAAVIGARDAADVLQGLSARLKGDEVVLLLSSGPLEGLAVSAPALLDRMFG